MTYLCRHIGVVFTALLVVAAVTVPANSTAAEDTAVPAALQSAGCIGCHALDQKLLGPAYQEIAGKYSEDEAAVAQLAEKLRAGSNGVWGPIPMMPLSAAMISDEDLNAVLEWILSQQPVDEPSQAAVETVEPGPPEAVQADTAQAETTDTATATIGTETETVQSAEPLQTALADSGTTPESTAETPDLMPTPAPALEPVGPAAELLAAPAVPSEPAPEPDDQSQSQSQKNQNQNQNQNQRPLRPQLNQRRHRLQHRPQQWLRPGTDRCDQISNQQAGLRRLSRNRSMVMPTRPLSRLCREPPS